MGAFDAVNYICVLNVARGNDLTIQYVMKLHLFLLNGNTVVSRRHQAFLVPVPVLARFLVVIFTTSPCTHMDM